MADVIFDEEQESTRQLRPTSEKPSAIVKIVYKLGLAKTRRGADYVLIAVIIICFALMYGVLLIGGTV